MNRLLLMTLAVYLGVACAGTAPPVSDSAIDWIAVADERVPTIVTLDPNGEERVTKLWLVVLDGQGLIRTSDTRWFGNIQRNPNVLFWVGGHAHPLRAELVADDSLVERAHELAQIRYSWLSVAGRVKAALEKVT